MTPSRSRILYIGMVCTDAYRQAIDEDVFVGAAAGKMGSVVTALRIAGRRGILVSLPFVGPLAGDHKYQREVLSGDGFPGVFLPTRRSPALRKVLGSLEVCLFAMRGVRSGDIVLFYNHAVEYILGLLILRLRGIAVFQDIEDKPISEDHGLRGILNFVGYKLMFFLTSPRKVTVSNQLGRSLGLMDYIAIQGIASAADEAPDEEKWAELESGGPLRVHYGGTLTSATGVDLFCATVRLLRDTGATSGRRVEFIVTGVGDIDQVERLASDLNSFNIRVDLHASVDRQTYFSLLRSCHASLSLKAIQSEISSTTFPSKVIEIAANRVALVTTVISDVDEIFTMENAWLLPEFTEEALGSIVEEMARNPAEVRRRAAAGQAVARASFAPGHVGEKLATFLEAGA